MTIEKRGCLYSIHVAWETAKTMGMIATTLISLYYLTDNFYIPVQAGSRASSEDLNNLQGLAIITACQDLTIPPSWVGRTALILDGVSSGNPVVPWEGTLFMRDDALIKEGYSLGWQSMFIPRVTYPPKPEEENLANDPCSPKNRPPCRQNLELRTMKLVKNFVIGDPTKSCNTIIKLKTP